MPKVLQCPDVQLNVTSTYQTPLKPPQVLPGFKPLPAVANPDADKIKTATALEQDALVRADYYLRGMLKEFQLPAGEVNDYNSIRAIDLDGAIQQVTWDINGIETRTIASRNCEHSTYVPPYPTRRRAEFLSPNRQAALENVAQAIDRGLMDPPVR
jgi:hypothetical protein